MDKKWIKIRDENLLFVIRTHIGLLIRLIRLQSFRLDVIIAADEVESSNRIQNLFFIV